MGATSTPRFSVISPLSTSIGPPSCPEKTPPQLVRLLLGSRGVHEHPDTPVAFGHDLRRVDEHGHAQAAYVNALDLARVDVKDQHQSATLGVGRHREPRSDAWAHHVAGAVLEVGTLYTPCHGSFSFPTRFPRQAVPFHCVSMMPHMESPRIPK